MCLLVCLSTCIRSPMFNYTQQTANIEFIEIAPASELPNGERLFVELEGKSIVIFNIAGQFFSIADVCSHDDGPVGEGDIEGYTITCPRHGAEFDIRSGKVLQLPAVVDIPAYPVRVVDGMIQVGIPKY
jgi:3-phenylpropionate/trans-cinnamate dioxygenase ferredoxin subunit